MDSTDIIMLLMYLGFLMISPMSGILFAIIFLIIELFDIEM